MNAPTIHFWGGKRVSAIWWPNGWGAKRSDLPAQPDGSLLADCYRTDVYAEGTSKKALIEAAVYALQQVARNYAARPEEAA